jgi:hypothetical protein
LRSVRLLFLAGTGFSLFLLSPVNAGEGTGDAISLEGEASPRLESSPSTTGVRDIPEPPRPGLETIPRGLAPRTWETWARGQDIDAMPRLSIRFLAFGAQPLPFSAGNGDQSPDWDDVAEFSPGLGLELGYQLAPTLALFLSMYNVFMSGGYYESEWMGNKFEADFDDNNVLGLGFGVKLSLPLEYSASRLLRFSRLEAPVGLNIYLKLAVGVANIDAWYFEYWSMTTWGSGPGWNSAGAISP